MNAASNTPASKPGSGAAAAGARCVLVTRPEPQASAWAGALVERGLDAWALPTLAIDPAPNPDAVRTAFSGLHDGALVVFVSPSAVIECLAALSGGRRNCLGRPWPAGVRAGATGPGTAAALRDCGVPHDAIVMPPPDSGHFDSEALWAQLQHETWLDRQVLIVRGNGGRPWLVDTMRTQGADVRQVQAYARRTADLNSEQRARLEAAMAAPQRHAFLFGSSEAAEHLALLVPAIAWDSVYAVATHDRIADKLQALGCQHVLTAAPTPDAVAAAVCAGF